MSSWLERCRLLHQDIENHEKMMVQTLLKQVRSDYDRIKQDHIIYEHMKEYINCCNRLINMYENEKNQKNNEFNEMKENSYSKFLQNISNIRKFYTNNPNKNTKPNETLNIIQPVIEFSGEEENGKYLDMHSIYDQYINMSQFKHLDYLRFLKSFYQFNNVAKNKKNKSYHKYLNNLLHYLKSYHSRTHPLVSQEKIDELINEEFEKQWQNKELDGWFDDNNNNTTNNDDDNKNNDNNQQNLYCKACARTFSKDTVYNAHFKGKKHKKNEAKMNKLSTREIEMKRIEIEKQKLTEWKTIANIEMMIIQYALMLQSVINNTIARVEQKQTLSYNEILAEREAARLEIDAMKDDNNSDESDEESTIYNPKNVPLGWDGKPIPYWLYKLHGLNLEFECEICGQYKYRGPRNFARHFSEARHSYGLKCLGITNTKHFHNVTKIQDALDLNEKLKNLSSELSWKPQEEEEFEDEHGNVFSKKLYDDLKRQGLL